MEIEIITTKEKLTKSLVNQMRLPSKSVMEDGKVLGFLIGVVKDCHKAILIQHDNNYYIISANFVKGEVTVYRAIGRASQTIRFKSPAILDDWWRAYQKVVKAANTQMYI